MNEHLKKSIRNRPSFWRHLYPKKYLKTFLKEFLTEFQKYLEQDLKESLRKILKKTPVHFLRKYSWMKLSRNIWRNPWEIRNEISKGVFEELYGEIPEKLLGKLKWNYYFIIPSIMRSWKSLWWNSSIKCLKEFMKIFLEVSAYILLKKTW